MVGNTTKCEHVKWIVHPVGDDVDEDKWRIECQGCGEFFYEPEDVQKYAPELIGQIRSDAAGADVLNRKLAARTCTCLVEDKLAERHQSFCDVYRPW